MFLCFVEFANSLPVMAYNKLSVNFFSLTLIRSRYVYVETPHRKIMLKIVTMRSNNPQSASSNQRRYIPVTRRRNHIPPLARSIIILTLSHFKHVVCSLEWLYALNALADLFKIYSLFYSYNIYQKNLGVLLLENKKT